MDLPAIAMFQELARSGSLRQTAEVCGVSPTAVTRQLDKLERQFGTALVERTPRGVQLTAAGEVLAAKSQDVARELTTARQMIDELKGLRRGHVTVHVNGAAISSILAPALSRFSEQHPQISIEVVVSSAQGALDAVATGQTDVAVTMFAPADARVMTRFRTPVRHEPVCAPDHPLAQQETVSVTDLIQHRLALPDRGYGVRRIFDTRLRAHGVEPEEVAFTTSSLELQKELARQGSAVLILPEMTVRRDLEAGALVLRPFAPPSRIETLLELSHSVSRPQSFAARQLLRFVEDFLGRYRAGSI